MVDFITAFCSSSANAKVEELLKLSTFAKVVVKIKVAPFLWTTVYICPVLHTSGTAHVVNPALLYTRVAYTTSLMLED